MPQTRSKKKQSSAIPPVRNANREQESQNDNIIETTDKQLVRRSSRRQQHQDPSPPPPKKQKPVESKLKLSRKRTASKKARKNDNDGDKDSESGSENVEPVVESQPRRAQKEVRPSSRGRKRPAKASSKPTTTERRGGNEEEEEEEEHEGGREETEAFRDGNREVEHHQGQPVNPRVRAETVNPLLPSRSLLPKPSDSHSVQREKMLSLREVVRKIIGEIMNEVQRVEEGWGSEMMVHYKSVEKIYTYFGEVYGCGSGDGEGRGEGDDDEDEAGGSILSTGNSGLGVEGLGRRYRNMVVNVLWGFGAVVWRVVGRSNVFMEIVKKFLIECFKRLGWEDRRRRRQRKNKNFIMKQWKEERYRPGCYYVCNLFVKHHSDTNTCIRQNQMTVMQVLVDTAVASDNKEFLAHVLKYCTGALMIRMKDKSTIARSKAMAILCGLLSVDGAEEKVMKELKYYTRYDPSAEVRRIGTRELSRVERLKLRFFYDQAFDRNFGVRFEALKVMGIEIEEEDEDEEGVGEGAERENNGEERMEDEEGNGEEQAEREANRDSKTKKVMLFREMDQLSKEKLCKLVIWGAFYSDVKCENYVKNDLLRKWLLMSCQGNLVKFIGQLDPFENLRTVNRIMDLMFRTGENEGLRMIEETVDFGFVDKLKENILGKKWKDVTVEGMVGWLGLCKASEEKINVREGGDNELGGRGGFLRGKVVPHGNEMGELLKCLHECVFLEHDQAVNEVREEDAGPVFCVVVALEICKFVVWEEGGRRHMKKLIQNILLDPIMDERMLVVQAMNVLNRDFTDMQEFEDVMMEVFQDVFDPRSEYNRKFSGRQRDGGKGSQEIKHENEDSNKFKEMETRKSDRNMDQIVNNPQPNLEQVQEQPAVVLMNPYQLTKLKEKLCELGMERFNLNNDKEKLLKEKKFGDAIPINERILKLQDEEAKVQALLREQQEEMEKRKNDLLRAAASNNSASAEVVRNVATVENGVSPMEHNGDSDEGTEEEDTEEINGKRNVRGGNLTGVINSVEEGLAKGLFMINGYMDLRPGMSPFIRNLYENYVLQFMTERDPGIRVSVIQFITRVAMSEKQELRRVANIVIRCVIGSDAGENLIVAGFKCLVDLLLVYKWEDFMLEIGEILEGKREGEEAFRMAHPYAQDYTKYLQHVLDDPGLTYENCNADHMRNMLIDLVTKKFPPPNASDTFAAGVYMNMITVKNQGLLKLLVRGKLRDPKVLADVLGLWVNNDYSGTSVLRDLECVLKLHGTFDWWRLGEFDGNSIVDEEEGEYVCEGGEDDEEGQNNDNDDQERMRRDTRNIKRNEAMRVLGVAVSEAAVKLCKEVTRRGGIGGGGGGGILGGMGSNHTVIGGVGGMGGGDKEDTIATAVKFVSYFLEFLDRKDQPLMRTMVCRILQPVEEYPTRSYNNLLVRCASRIPITSFTSAKKIIEAIGSIYRAMRNHPGTTSVTNTLKEVTFFFKKLKRVFGDEVKEGVASIIEWERGLERMRGGDDEDLSESDDDEVDAGGGADDVARFTSSGEDD